MLKIKLLPLLFIFSLSLSAQDFCASLFDEIQLKSEFMPLSSEELIELCTRQSGDFNQTVFTYGSDNPTDWLRVSECVQRFSDDMQPEGRWLDLNGDEFLDLEISFLAGYEYTFVAFYLQKNERFSCVHTGVGEFYGVQMDGSLVYVNPACCEDPSHEFYVLEMEDESRWDVVDSFSVSHAYSSAFPTKDELRGASDAYASTVKLTAVGANAKEILRFPEGAVFSLIKQIEGDGQMLHFARVHWQGNAIFLPKTYCLIQIPE